MLDLSTEFIVDCKDKLLKERENLIQLQMQNRNHLNDLEVGGDEADQSNRQISEINFIQLMERVRLQMFEVDQALQRIESGNYGVCEETGEPIEAKRLKVIPWTRLSIEGAEIREAKEQRYMVR